MAIASLGASVCRRHATGRLEIATRNLREPLQHCDMFQFLKLWALPIPTQLVDYGTVVLSALATLKLGSFMLKIKFYLSLTAC